MKNQTERKDDENIKLKYKRPDCYRGFFNFNEQKTCLRQVFYNLVIKGKTLGCEIKSPLMCVSLFLHKAFLESHPQIFVLIHAALRGNMFL